MRKCITRKLPRQVLWVVGLCATVVVTASGCSDRDQRFWANVLDSTFSDSGHSSTRCHRYRDYRGNWREECYTEHHHHDRPRHDRGRHGRGRGHGHGHGRHHFVELAQASEVEATPAMIVGNKFDMSYESAQKLITTLDQAVATGKLDDLKKVGMEEEDLERMAELKFPKEKNMRRIASALDQDHASTRVMISRILDEIQKAKALED